MWHTSGDFHDLEPSAYLEHTPGVKLSDYMFRSESANSRNKNEPLSKQAVDAMLKGIAKELGLGNRMATHTLRKTFAYGIVAGTKLLFDTNGTTITPEFMDKAGELTFDKDGMPVNANFFLDGRTGEAYFRGKVHATEGVFNGTVYAKEGEFTGTVHAKAGEFDGTVMARDLYLSDGTSMKSALNERGKIDADWLDLYGINVLNKAGDTVLTIDEGGLRFGSGYSPIKYQYGSSASGPWHDEMAGNDKYRRDSLDGGTSWGTPYQFVGTDGKNGSNGSDASVTYSNIKRALQKAANISDAYMTMDDIGAPTISGGKIIGCEFLGGDYKLYSQNGAGAFTLIGDYGSDLYEFLKIEYSKLPTPRICIFSPAGAEIEFGKTRNGRTSFYGAVNFSDATVTGITATFA